MKSLLADGDSLLAAPHSVYPCKDDRWCAVAVFTEEEWRGLKRALGSPAWAEEARFAAPEKRRDNRAELDRLIAAWTREHTAEEVMSKFQENGVAAGIVQDAADLAGDPQLKARGFFVKGKAFTDASPVRMELSGAEYGRSAPTPGQDNDYVYGKLLGLSEEKIADLKDKGVI
jgi:benzylsuccinate CoA-transferase BbsF subunit